MRGIITKGSMLLLRYLARVHHATHLDLVFVCFMQLTSSRGLRRTASIAAALAVRQGSMSLVFFLRLGVRPAEERMSYCCSSGTAADSCRSRGGNSC